MSAPFFLRGEGDDEEFTIEVDGEWDRFYSPPTLGLCVEENNYARARVRLTAEHLRELIAQFAVHLAKLAPRPEPRRVRKVGGSFQHSGTVLSEFVTLGGDRRVVVEFDPPVAGMLQVYRPDQVETIEEAA